MAWRMPMLQVATARALAISAVFAPLAGAEPMDLKISEILINSPNNEVEQEYFELKGPANTAIPAAADEPGHFTYWWVEVENEQGASAKPGQIDKACKLSGALDANGTAFFSPTTSPCRGVPAAAYGRTMENSGATYLLIAVANTAKYTPATYPATDWDAENDGHGDGVLDVDFAAQGWVLLDSVGVFAKGADISGGGRLYSPHVNFIAGDASSGVGASYPTESYINTDVENAFRCSGAFDEIKYVGRISSADTWFAANLVDNGTCDYPVAPDAENLGYPEAKSENGTSPHDACGIDITSRGAINPTASFFCL